MRGDEQMYQRKYRSTPREIAIRDDDMVKALLLVLGLVTTMMLIAFA